MNDAKGRIRTLLEVDETIRDLGRTLVHLEASLTRLDTAIVGLERTVERLGGVAERADRLLDVVETMVLPVGRIAAGVRGVAARLPRL